MPSPFIRDHADPVGVKWAAPRGDPAGGRRDERVGTLRRAALYATQPLSTIKLLRAPYIRDAIMPYESSKIFRLATLPPYFSAYVPTRGGGGGGSGPVKLPPVKFDPPGKGVGTPEFIGRSRDRLKL